MIFDLSGMNAAQRSIVEQAVARCTFDFDRLQPALRAIGRERISVSFRDLSDPSGYLRAQPVKHRGGYLALAYTDGRIYLERTLVEQPMLGQESFLAEAAHMVDFFYLTDEDRDAIIDATWTSGDKPGWWSGSYLQQVGEVFMGAFTRAFSDLGHQLEFEWGISNRTIDAVRRRLTGAKRLGDAIRSFAEQNSTTIEGSS